MKTASAIDYPRPTLPPSLWDLGKKPPVLQGKIRQDIINTLTESLESEGYRNPLEFVSDLILTGSSATNVCKENCDVDVDVVLDLKKLRERNPGLHKLSDDDLIPLMRKIVYKANKSRVGGTRHTYSFMVLRPDDHVSGDNLYDILGNKWVKGPTLIPLDFDPDKAFAKQKEEAIKIGRWIDGVVGTILQIVKDLEVLDQYQRIHGGKEAHRVMLLHALERWCKILDTAYYFVWGLQMDAKAAKGGARPLYFSHSPNWDERMIVFKYLVRAGYDKCIYNLYKTLEGNPYLEVIDRFIPD